MTTHTYGSEQDELELKKNCLLQNRLLMVIVLIVMLAVLSACSSDIKGELKTLDQEPLVVKQADDSLVAIQPGPIQINLKNGTPLFQGAVEIKNAKGEIIAKVPTPHSMPLLSLNFFIRAPELGQRFDLVGRIRELPPRERTYVKNDYECKYCAQCMNPKAVDYEYRPSLREKIANNFQPIIKHTARVEPSCDCPGHQRAILKETTKATQSAVYFADGQKLIAHFSSEPLETKTTEVVRELTKCGDQTEKITTTEFLDTAIPAVVEAVSDAITE